VPPPFSRLTTIGVGGAPRALIEPSNEAELIDEMRGLWGAGEDWLLLGGGSNTVASDDGFDGTVVRIATHGVERLTAASDDSRVCLRVEAGEEWDQLVALSVHEGWSGIEALSGIPGRVGAAPVQNIGAYGQELSSVLRSVDFLDYDSGVCRRFEAAELGLGYRTSAIKRGLAGVVIAVELELQVSGDGLSAPVTYDQLARRLGVALGSRVPLADLREAILALRAAKGMLLDAEDPDTRSAGSFFTNPIVDENVARSLVPASAPRWLVDPDEPDTAVPLSSPAAGTFDPERYTDRRRQVKLSAAWLIEHSGIPRGFRLHGSRAAISRKHTLAITNTGGASAAEVMQLAAFVRARVQAEFGVLLQPEPVLVGLELD
jgi:UDP-N-acetylmuramate dehydrogenase